MQWLQEGDSNMRLFHCLTNSHGRVNFVVEVEVGGVD